MYMKLVKRDIYLAHKSSYSIGTNLKLKVVVVMNKERSFGKWRKGVGGFGFSTQPQSRLLSGVHFYSRSPL